MVSLITCQLRWISSVTCFHSREKVLKLPQKLHKFLSCYIQFSVVDMQAWHFPTVIVSPNHDWAHCFHLKTNTACMRRCVPKAHIIVFCVSEFQFHILMEAVDLWINRHLTTTFQAYRGWAFDTKNSFSVRCNYQTDKWVLSPYNFLDNCWHTQPHQQIIITQLLISASCSWHSLLYITLLGLRLYACACSS